MSIAQGDHKCIINYSSLQNSVITVLSSQSLRHEWTCLHGPVPDRLQDCATLLLPRSKRLEQLDDLIPLALSHVVDADHAHLDVIVEQKVEQGEKPLEIVVVRLAWERAVGHDVGPHAFDRLCDPEELQTTADGTIRRDLKRAR